MGATVFSICVGFFTPKRRVTVALFPYFALGCAIIFLISYCISMSVMVRFGSLSKVAPWDGQARLLLAMVLIFLPRMMHLPLAFAMSLNVVSVLSFELLLDFMFNLYSYDCWCYQLASENISTVRI